MEKVALIRKGAYGDDKTLHWYGIPHVQCLPVVMVTDKTPIGQWLIIEDLIYHIGNAMVRQSVKSTSHDGCLTFNQRDLDCFIGWR